jgi:hypothetical protein
MADSSKIFISPDTQAMVHNALQSGDATSALQAVYDVVAQQLKVNSALQRSEDLVLACWNDIRQQNHSITVIALDENGSYRSHQIFHRPEGLESMSAAQILSQPLQNGASEIALITRSPVYPDWITREKEAAFERYLIGHSEALGISVADRIEVWENGGNPILESYHSGAHQVMDSKKIAATLETRTAPDRASHEVKSFGSSPAPWIAPADANAITQAMDSGQWDTALMMLHDAALRSRSLYPVENEIELAARSIPVMDQEASGQLVVSVMDSSGRISSQVATRVHEDPAVMYQNLAPAVYTDGNTQLAMVFDHSRSQGELPRFASALDELSQRLEDAGVTVETRVLLDRFTDEKSWYLSDHAESFTEITQQPAMYHEYAISPAELAETYQVDIHPVSKQPGDEQFDHGR